MNPKRSPKILDPARAVLVVIDIQEKLHRAIEGKDNITKSAVKTIKLAKVFDLPIIATEQYPKGLGETIPEIKAELEGIEFIPKLEYSAFDQESFRKQLEETGRDQIMLIGIEAHICILQTALDVLETGKQVHLIVDSTGSRDNWSKKFGMKRIKQAGGFLSTNEMAAYELMRKAKTPEFKEVIGFLFE